MYQDLIRNELNEAAETLANFLPKQPIIMSGYSPAISICFSASRPITV